MDWLIEIGFVLLFLIVVIWLVLRDEPHRHSAKKGRHRIRRNNGYTDSASGYPVIMGDDSYDRHARHTHRITNIMIQILQEAHILITTAIVVAAMTAVGIVAAETVGVAGIKHHFPITKEGLYPLLCKHNSGTALCRSLAPVRRRGLTIKRGYNH